MEAVKRTITGRTASRTMSLGDLRQFIGSLDSLPDEAQVKAKVTFRKLLRSVTVEEDDAGFRDFVRAAKQGDDAPTEARKGRAPKQVSPESSAV
jgi:hypothetical protein